MIYPVQNHKITSPYGLRTLPDRTEKFHYGVDFTGKNKECYTVCDLEIDKITQPDFEYPCKFKYVNDKFVLDESVPIYRAWTPFIICHAVHDSNLVFIYKHIKSFVTAGQIVSEGIKIGELGNYGFSMGSHLHFEVIINNKNVNPEQWLKDNVS